MGGKKYLLVVAVFMMMVLVSCLIILEQFNLMVYPAHVTAFGLNKGEAGYTIEVLGENICFCLPDPQNLNRMVEQSQQLLLDYVTKLKDKGELFMTKINNSTFSECLQQVTPK